MRHSTTGSLVLLRLKRLFFLLVLSTLPCVSMAEEAAETHSTSVELPSIVSIICDLKIGGTMVRDMPIGHILETWSQQIMLLILVAISVCFMLKISRHIVVYSVPGKMQVAMELLVSAIKNFLLGLLGENNKKHVPVFATLLLFILVMNLAGIVPFFSAPTCKFQTTVTLAIFIMIYYHYHSFKLGWKHVIMHLLNNPKNGIMWALSPFFFVINCIEIITRPLSLSLRLFGNVMGKDLLLGIFMIIGLNMTMAMIPGTIIGIPLHFPFLFLGLMLGIIQALVFTILSTIYLTLWTSTHDDEDEAGKVEEKSATTGAMAS